MDPVRYLGGSGLFYMIVMIFMLAYLVTSKHAGHGAVRAICWLIIAAGLLTGFVFAMGLWG